LFEANTAPTYRGGAIAADENASVTISRSNFTQNVAIEGGAIVSLAKRMSISASTFTANRATNNGGAVNFDSRRSTNGSVVEYPEVIVSSCEFFDNTASASGGAVFSDRAQLTIQQVCGMYTTERERNYSSKYHSLNCNCFALPRCRPNQCDATHVHTVFVQCELIM
jgi:predicted outer membrane repeat protein